MPGKQCRLEFRNNIRFSCEDTRELFLKDVRLFFIESYRSFIVGVLEQRSNAKIGFKLTYGDITKTSWEFL